MMCTRSFVIGVALLASFAISGEARADLSEFYIGTDNLETFTSGTYNGLQNPNYGRLTFLYAHGNHYHSIGAYAYTGANLGASTVVEDTNSNNRIPETYTTQAPLVLTAGSGGYAGKLVSNPLVGVDYSDLETRNVHSLDGSPDDVNGLFNSSSDRWSAELGDGLGGHAHIHLELVSATPGLNVGSLTNPNALSVGGDTHVGDGDELFSFTPVLWVDGAAAPGTYTAEFRLVDENGYLGDSGRFFVDSQVVPEPSSLVLAILGLPVALGLRRYAPWRAARS